MLITIIFVFSPVSFEGARAYQERRRNVPPALYNYSPRWLRVKRTQPRAGQNLSTFFRLHASSGNLNIDSNNEKI